VIVMTWPMCMVVVSGLSLWACGFVCSGREWLVGFGIRYG
jgi:hypothetical protein